MTIKFVGKNTHVHFDKKRDPLLHIWAFNSCQTIGDIDKKSINGPS